MVLTKIIIVSLSIAAASSAPHGHGINGGSAAIAKSGAVAGAITFPEGIPSGFGGSGSYSSSGSFAKSSASSFASSSAGSFSFGGSGGYGNGAPSSGGPSGQYGGASGSAGAGEGGYAAGAPDQYGKADSGPGSGSGAGTVSAAVASAGAFAGALAGSGGPGLPSNERCSGNCPVKDQGKPQDSVCQGASCEPNYQLPKCTSGACDDGSSPHSQSTAQSQGQESKPQNTGFPKGFIPVDAHDRPGKIDGSQTNEVPQAGNHKEHSSSDSSKSYVQQPCSSNGCGSSIPVSPTPCTSPNCGQSPLKGSVSCTSPGCGQYATDNDVKLSPTSKAEAGTSSGGYDHSHQLNPEHGRTPILNAKPNSGYATDKTKRPHYNGGFGGPPGILKPNDYSFTAKPGHLPQDVSPSISSSSTGGQYGTHDAPNKPAIYEQPPNHYNPSIPSSDAAPSNVSPTKPNPNNSYYGNHGSGAFSGAVAGANSAAYVGSFGGPPGILKPNDFSLHGLKPGGISRPHSDKGPTNGPEAFPAGQSQGKPEYPGKPTSIFQPVAHSDETSYQGGFGGAPGIIRPNGPHGTGTFPSQQPQEKPETPTAQHEFPKKPEYGCNPGSGSKCSGAKPGSYDSPIQQPGKPSVGCGPGSDCAGGHLDSYGSSLHHPEKPIVSCEPGSNCAGGQVDSYGTPLQKPNVDCAPGSPCAGVQSNSYGSPIQHVGQPNVGCGPGSGCSELPLVNHRPSIQNLGKPNVGCGPGSKCTGRQPGGHGSSLEHPDKPNEGCELGSECAAEQTGHIGDSLQHTDKPNIGCGPGTKCAGGQSGAYDTPHQYPGKPGSGCEPGSGCNDEKPYHGGFGGPPGIIRPTGSASVFPGLNLGITEDQKPQHGYSNNGNSDATGYGSDSGYSGAPGNIGCGPGTKCAGGQPGAYDTPDQYPGKPGAGCEPGSGCNDEKPYHGGFGGPPGTIRPTGSASVSPGLNVGNSEDQKPQHSYSNNGNSDATGYGSDSGYSGAPGNIGCGPGTKCAGGQPGAYDTPDQYPGKPGAGCEPGSGCNDEEPYHGGFGGPPGIIRPTGSASVSSGLNLGNSEDQKPQHSYSNNGNSGASGYGSDSGYSGAPAHASPVVTGSSAGAGAFAGAVAGSFGGYGGLVGHGGHGGSQGGYGGHPGYNHGSYATKNAGFVKGCSGDCTGNSGTQGSHDGAAHGGGYGTAGGFDFGAGLNAALAGAKSLAGSLSIAGASAGVAAGSGAAAGGAGGSYGQAGSFASASASAGAKSYGGYH